MQRTEKGASLERMDFISNKENCIEWENGQKDITVSFCGQKWINKVKNLSEKRPDEVKMVAENKDGSICAKLPITYLKLSPPRQVSEEQRLAASERLKQYRAENAQEKENR